MSSGRVSAALVNQKQTKEKKMKPNEIATSLSGLKPIGEGNVTLSTMGTNSYVGQNYTVDDWNTWD